jgi:hypothetical protein
MAAGRRKLAAEESRDEEVSEKSPRMRHCQVSSCPEQAGLAPYWALESLGMERTKEMAPTAAVGSTIGGGQDAKTEILAKILWNHGDRAAVKC